MAVFLAAAVPAGALAQTAHLAAGAKTLWLVVSEGDLYRLAVRWMDKPWAKLPVEAQGAVAVLAVSRDSAVVFFHSGRSVRYFAHQQAEQQGVRAPRALWPSGTKVLSACPAGGEEFSVLVLVHRPLRPRVTTQPAGTAPAGIGAAAATKAAADELAVLRFDGEGWQELAVVPERGTGRPRRGRLAQAAGKIYLLLERPDRRFLVFQQGRWQPLALPARMARGRALALGADKDQVVLVGFNLDAPGRVSIARHASGQWQKTRMLKAGDEQITWPANAPPVAALGAEAVALAWEEEKKWYVGEFDFQGRRLRPPEDIFARAGAAESAGKARDYFLWGVLLTLMVLMFWPGQTPRTAAFSLPPGLQVARVGRRLVAFVIDVLPFAGVAFYVAGGSDPQGLLRSLKDGAIEVEHVYASLGFLVAYPAYGILLEQLFGATFGKMAMRLRVIGDAGKRPSLREIALRNISKIPELIVLILLVFPLFTRYRQRLGDKIAWTAVIDMELSSIAPPPPDASQQPPGTGAEEDEEKL